MWPALLRYTDCNASKYWEIWGFYIGRKLFVFYLPLEGLVIENKWLKMLIYKLSYEMFTV
jgi:hypothetical protein